MKRFGLVAIAALLVVLSVSRAAAQQVTVNVNVSGQPASGLSVVFVAANLIKTPQAQPNAQPTEGNANALNLGNMLKTRTATTDSSGTSVLDLSNIIKPKGQTQVQITVRTCKDGKNVVYIVQSAAEIPPHDEKCVNNNDCKCKDRAAGFFLIHDGDKITVNITPESVDVHVMQTGGGAVAVTGTGFMEVISIEVGGGIGFKHLAGTHGEMLPGGTFETPSPTAFAGDVGGAVNLGPVFLGNYFYAASGVSSNGNTSLPGGSTDMVDVNRTFRGDTLTVGAGVPLGSRISFNVHGGGNFWHVNLDTKETVSSGGSGSGGSTVSNSRGVDGTGWTVGAAVHVKISGRWNFVAGYDYLPMSNAGVNVHLNEGTFGVTYRFLGKP
jgi:hypothetical protein